MMAAGSGVPALMREQTWMRKLRRLVKAYDEKRARATVVSDFLAGISLEVSRGTRDGTVGPNCIVAWRNSKLGPYRGGGGHVFYDGIVRSPNTPSLPTVARGMDVGAISQLIMEIDGPRLRAHLEAMMRGDEGPMPAPNDDEIRRRLAELPYLPDEKLR